MLRLKAIVKSIFCCKIANSVLQTFADIAPQFRVAAATGSNARVHRRDGGPLARQRGRYRGDRCTRWWHKGLAAISNGDAVAAVITAGKTRFVERSRNTPVRCGKFAPRIAGVL
jgi:hypothetical protein